jgi:hypothetical protein
MWLSHPDVTWNPLPEGDGLSYLTQPFTTTAAYAGTGSVDLWLRSNAADTDIEVTLTELRPDGSEVYIQSGWLRASHRQLDPAMSTPLLPYHTHMEADARPLPRDTFEPLRIEIFPFAHVVRPGSRLRMNIEAPSGNQPFWSFDTLAPNAYDGRPEVRNDIGHATAMPSRVVLPRLPDNVRPDVPATPPSCQVDGVTAQSQSLRNQPCRPYVAPRIPVGVTVDRHPHAELLDRPLLKVNWTAPPEAAAPTGYRVHVLTTGEVVDVPAGTTGVDLVRPSPDRGYAIRVQARYDDVLAPRSDASLGIRGD